MCCARHHRSGQFHGRASADAFAATQSTRMSIARSGALLLERAVRRHVQMGVAYLHVPFAVARMPFPDVTIAIAPTRVVTYLAPREASAGAPGHFRFCPDSPVPRRQVEPMCGRLPIGVAQLNQTSIEIIERHPIQNWGPGQPALMLSEVPPTRRKRMLTPQVPRVQVRYEERMCAKLLDRCKNALRILDSAVRTLDGDFRARRPHRPPVARVNNARAAPFGAISDAESQCLVP